MGDTFFLIGSGRSGTTVMMESLFRHKDLAYLSNYHDRFLLNPLNDYLRYLFDNKFYRLFGQKPQLNSVSRYNSMIFKPTEAYNFWNFFNEDYNFSRSFLTDVNVSAVTKEKINLEIDRIRRRQGKKYFATKLTGPNRIHFLNQLFPNSKYVIFQRSFIPTLHSFLQVNFWENRKNTIWWDGNYSEVELAHFEKIKGDPLLMTACQLYKIKIEEKKVIQKFPKQILVVRYEDFVSDPGKELEQILRFFGLSDCPDCFDYLKKNTIFNRNKAAGEYFSKQEIEQLESHIPSDILFS